MRNVLIIVLILWAVCFFGSFVVFYAEPIIDFGLPDNWNKLGFFVIGQLAATILAAVSLALRWAAKDAALQRWAAVPSLAIGIFLIIVFGIYLWSGTSA